MAPEAANQKRKRGRPTNASRDENDDDASKTQLTLTNKGRLAGRAVSREDPEADEGTRPKKRGRPSRVESPPEPEPESSAQPQGNKRKRGQPSLSKGDADINQGKDGNSGFEETQPKKKGRGAINTRAAKESEQKSGEPVDPKSIQPKKSGRPRRDVGVRVEQRVEEEIAPESKQPKRTSRQRKGPQTAKKVEVTAEEEADDENEDNSSFLRRSGRTRRLERDKDAQHGSEDTREPKTNTNQTKRRGQRRKPTEEPPEDAVEESQPTTQSKKNHGRSSREGGSPAEPHPAPETGRKKRGHPSSIADSAGPSMKPKPARRNRLSQNHEASAQEDVPRRRRSNQSDNAPTPSRGSRRSPRGPNQQSPRSASPDSDSSPPPYRRLTTRTRRVPRHTIDAKWTPLDPSSVSSVTNLLHSASRPVLIRLNNLQRHKYATAALNTVSNRLRSKLTRGLPFPPATTSTRREDELEFERTISGIQTLESQLDPLLHSVELLKREKARAEKELEREYRILNQLGTNARAEKRERRDRLRKMHVLVPEKPHESNVAGGDALGLVPKDRSAGRVFAELGDQGQGQDQDQEANVELRGLAGQIGNHMESMRGNLQQIDGVVPAIAKSRALLKAALQQHLDEEVLEGVVLG